MEIRPIQRDGKCRGCSKRLYKGDLIFYTYSSANRGMSIIFCIECSERIGDMYNEYLEAKNDPNR